MQLCSLLWQEATNILCVKILHWPWGNQINNLNNVMYEAKHIFILSKRVCKYKDRREGSNKHDVNIFNGLSLLFWWLCIWNIHRHCEWHTRILARLRPTSYVCGHSIILLLDIYISSDGNVYAPALSPVPLSKCVQCWLGPTIKKLDIQQNLWISNSFSRAEKKISLEKCEHFFVNWYLHKMNSQGA